MDWRELMKQKWILTGAAFSLAAVLSGCSNIPVLNQLQNSQAQTQTDSMGETKERRFLRRPLLHRPMRQS